jgi:type IV pilus assembly protein PilA
MVSWNIDMKSALEFIQRKFSSSRKELHNKNSRGFTLIELLVVIGILAVLLAITLIAINPARQFAQANNTQRASDVNAILNAVWQFGVDNNGDLTALGLPVSPTAAATIGSNTAGGEINLCPEISPQYIAEMPVDPQNGTWIDCTDYSTGYTIVQTSATAGARVTVSAPGAELGQSISVTR